MRAGLRSQRPPDRDGGSGGTRGDMDVESGRAWPCFTGPRGASAMSPSAPTDRASPYRTSMARFGCSTRTRAHSSSFCRFRMRRSNGGVQSGRYEARFGEPVRRCSDLGPRHRAICSRSPAGRSRGRSPTRSAASTTSTAATNAQVRDLFPHPDGQDPTSRRLPAAPRAVVLGEPVLTETVVTSL